jgi:hypothetical protein
VEFVFLGLLLLLLVPVVFFMITIAALQGASFAAAGAAERAAKSFAQTKDEASARAASEASVRVALGDFGLADHSARLELTCDRSLCLQAGGRRGRCRPRRRAPALQSVFRQLGLTVGRVDASSTQIGGRRNQFARWQDGSGQPLGHGPDPGGELPAA